MILTSVELLTAELAVVFHHCLNKFDVYSFESETFGIP